MYDGYLTYGGIEIINAERARVYAQNGLVPTSVDVNCGCDSIAEAVGDEPYTSTIVDQPPWYDPNDAYANDFAGIIPLEITGLSGSTRVVEVMERLGDGGIPVRGRAASRTIAVTAALLARSQGGVEAGLAWLSSTLHPPCGVAPTGCTGETLQMFTACPETCEGITDPDADPVTSVFETVDMVTIGGDLGGNITPDTRHNLVPAPSFELQSGGEGTAPDGWTPFDIGENGTITYTQVAGDGVTSQNYAIDFYADAQGYGGPSGDNMLADPGFESGVGGFTGVGGASVAQAGNVLSAEDSTFEGGTLGGWGAGGNEPPTIVNDTAHPHSGTKSMRITWGNAVFFPQVGHGGANIPVTPGLTYTLSAWVWVALGAPRVALLCQNASAESHWVNRWERLSVTFTVPGGTTFTDIQILASGDLSAINGTQCWVDDISLAATVPRSGLQDLQIIWPTGGAPSARNSVAGFTPGESYTAMAWVYVPTGHPDVRIQISGGLQGTRASEKDRWVQTQVSWVAAGANVDIDIVPVGGNTAGQVCYVDDVEVRTGFPTWPFEGGLNGWGGSNGTTAVATDLPGIDGVLPHNEARMMEVTWSGDQVNEQQVWYNLTGLVPGQPYTFTAWVYVPEGHPDVRMDIWLLAISPPMTLKTAWVQMQMTFTATSANHLLRFIPGSAYAAGQVLYVDDAYVTSGTLPLNDAFGLTCDVPATPGETYWGAADLALVNLPAGHDAALYVLAFDNGNTMLGSWYATADPAVHAQTLTVSPFEAPANTDHLQVSLRVYGNGGGWQIVQPIEVKWDSVIVGTGGVVPYFDGESTNTEAWTYTWDGAPNASASTATAPAAGFSEFVPFDPGQGGTIATPWLNPVCDIATVSWNVVNTDASPIRVYATSEDSTGQVSFSEPEETSHGTPDVTNAAALTEWFADLDDRDHVAANVVFLGDSITEGLVAGGWDATFERLFKYRAQQRYPVSGVTTPGFGWVPATNVWPFAPPILAGDPVVDVTSGRGLGMKNLRVATGQSVTWPLTWCDQIKVVWSQAAANAGRGVLSIDGQDVATLNSSAPVAVGGQVWDSGAISPGPHTLAIRGIDANPFIVSGADFFYGDQGKGVHVYDSGHIGAEPDTFNIIGANTGHWDDYAALKPSVTVINLGVNGDWTDSAGRLADIDTLIGLCDANSDRNDGRGPRPILLVVPYRSVHQNETPQEDAGFDTFCAGLKQRATGHVAVYDLRAHWPTLAAGQGHETGLMYEDDWPQHPNTEGHDLIADLMMSALAPDVTVVYGMTLPVGGGTVIDITTDPTPGFPNDWHSTLHTTGTIQVHASLNARPEIALEDCVAPLLRTYRNVVTVAGPTEVERIGDSDGETIVSRVEWTMVAGEPYAYGSESAIAVSVDSANSSAAAAAMNGAIVTARTSIDYAGTECPLPTAPVLFCNDDPTSLGLPQPPVYPTIIDTSAPEVLAYWRRTVQFPNPPGVAALLLVITSDAQAKKGLRVRVWHEDDCDIAMPDECAFDWEFTVDYLPPGSTLLVNTADKTALASCPDGSYADHTRNMHGNYGGPFQFPIVGCGDCSRIAVDVPKNYVSGGVPGLSQGNVIWSAYMAHRMG